MADSIEERRAAKTLPPTDIGFPAPPGRVHYASVFDDDTLVGFVWAADREDARPRAGILLMDVDVVDPSVAFQSDLGTVSLVMSRRSGWDPVVWLEHLAETRRGVGGGLLVGERATAHSLDGLRRLTRG